jgi:hypothetical protein
MRKLLKYKVYILVGIIGIVIGAVGNHILAKHEPEQKPRIGQYQVLTEPSRDYEIKYPSDNGTEASFTNPNRKLSVVVKRGSGDNAYLELMALEPTNPLKDIVTHTETSPVLTSEQLVSDYMLSPDQVSADKTYRLIEESFSVTDDYSPKVQIFAETDESKDKPRVVNLVHVNFDTKDGDKRKYFNGEVFVNVELPDIIYYSVNGDFYDGGETISELEKHVEDGAIEVFYQLDEETTHYQYTYQEHRINLD